MQQFEDMWHGILILTNILILLPDQKIMGDVIKFTPFEIKTTDKSLTDCDSELKY